LLQLGGGLNGLLLKIIERYKSTEIRTEPFMQKHKLLDSIRLGDLELRNRVVMAPMTRARGEASSHLATDLMAEYYRQRAGAGLIITEGTWPNDESVGFVGVPGMFTKQQADSWKKVTNSVHEHGGKIFSQLGHCGPNAHPDLLGGKLPVSASAINIRSMAFTHPASKRRLLQRRCAKKTSKGLKPTSQRLLNLRRKQALMV
jgi:2,4-dienoyl-CoA reductase-like NADH-dependent reductase (Old Yellow Enzyme family)